MTGTTLAFYMSALFVGLLGVFFSSLTGIGPLGIVMAIGALAHVVSDKLDAILEAGVVSRDRQNPSDGLGQKLTTETRKGDSQESQ